MRRTRGLWTSIVVVGLLVVASLAGLLTDRLSPTLGLDLEGGHCSEIRVEAAPVPDEAIAS